MIYWGVNALNHGSSIAVFNNEQYINSIVSASDTPCNFPSERPDKIYWYERPWLKKARQVYAGQYLTALDMSVLPSRAVKEWGLGKVPILYTPHHASHAAAGYYTSPFNHCAVVVLDAIGEFESATIWEGSNGKLKKLWSRSYPHSLGLFYSAFTKTLGMTPIKDEYLLQQMAQRGNPKRFQHYINRYFKPGVMNFDYNFHRGVRDQKFYIESVEDECDLAAAVQQKFVEQIDLVMKLAVEITKCDSLVYMGGCSMNSDANRLVVEPKFKYIWSLPQPGDPSSSIGAVLYHTENRLQNVNLGTVKHINIKI